MTLLLLLLLLFFKAFALLVPAWRAVVLIVSVKLGGLFR